MESNTNRPAFVQFFQVFGKPVQLIFINITPISPTLNSVDRIQQNKMPVFMVKGTIGFAIAQTFSKHILPVLHL